MSGEDRILRSLLKASSVLLQSTAPHTVPAAARAIARLSMPHPPAALLEAALEGASHHLRPVCCANEACGREFLFGEWCRDGDAYRCAWCNTLSHPDGSISAPDANAQGTRAIRAFEKRVNERFLAYAAAYFGRGAQTTCYAWRRGEVASHGSEDDEIQVAVLVRNVPVETSTAAGAAAEWNSTHAVSLRLAHGDGTLEVRGASTVFIDRSVAPCRFSGHVTRTFPTSRATLPLAVRDTVTGGACLEDLLRTDAGRTALLVALGDHVQTVENRLRDVVASVYFGKAGQLATDLRSRVARSIAETSVGPQVVTVADAAPRQPLDVASYMPERPHLTTSSEPYTAQPDADAEAAEEIERQRKKEEKRRRRAAEAEAAAAAEAAVTATAAADEGATGEVAAATAGPSADVTEWTAAQDEEGNTYYYCEALGETAWELPPGGIVVEAKKKKKSKASHHQDPVVAAADAEAVEAWTIGSALAAMGLTTPAAEIEALLADQGIETFTDLGVYCHDAEYLVSLGIEDEGDRKRISKWVRKNVPAQ